MSKPRQNYLLFLNCVLMKQKENKREQKGTERICALNIKTLF